MSDKTEKQAISEDERAAMCAIHKFKRNCTDDCSNCSFKLPEPFTAEIGENSVIGWYYPNETLMREIRNMADVEAVKYAMQILKVYCESKPCCDMCRFYVDGVYDSCRLQKCPRNWEVDE